MCTRIFIAELVWVPYKWKNWMFMEGLGEIMKEWINKLGFPDSSVGKESSCNAGDRDAIPGSGRSPGKGIGYPLQYSGLENSMDCIVYGIAKSWTRLRNFYFQPGHSHQPHSCLTHPFHQDFLLGGGTGKWDLIESTPTGLCQGKASHQGHAKVTLCDPMDCSNSLQPHGL